MDPNQRASVVLFVTGLRHPSGSGKHAFAVLHGARHCGDLVTAVGERLSALDQPAVGVVDRQEELRPERVRPPDLGAEAGPEEDNGLEVLDVPGCDGGLTFGANEFSDAGIELPMRAVDAVQVHKISVVRKRRSAPQSAIRQCEQVPKGTILQVLSLRPETHESREHASVSMRPMRPVSKRFGATT